MNRWIIVMALGWALVGLCWFALSSAPLVAVVAGAGAVACHGYGLWLLGRRG